MPRAQIPPQQQHFFNAPAPPVEDIDDDFQIEEESDTERERPKKRRRTTPTRPTSKFEVMTLDDLESVDDKRCVVSPFFLRRGNRLWFFFRHMGEKNVSFSFDTDKEENEIGVSFELPFPKGADVGQFPEMNDDSLNLGGEDQKIEVAYKLPVSMKINPEFRKRFDEDGFFGCVVGLKTQNQGKQVF